MTKDKKITVKALGPDGKWKAAQGQSVTKTTIKAKERKPVYSDKDTAAHDPYFPHKKNAV